MNAHFIHRPGDGTLVRFGIQQRVGEKDVELQVSYFTDPTTLKGTLRFKLSAEEAQKFSDMLSLVST